MGTRLDKQLKKRPSKDDGKDPLRVSQMIVRVPTYTYRRFKAVCADQGHSVQELVNMLIKEELRRDKLLIQQEVSRVRNSEVSKQLMAKQLASGTAPRKNRPKVVITGQEGMPKGIT